LNAGYTAFTREAVTPVTWRYAFIHKFPAAWLRLRGPVILSATRWKIAKRELVRLPAPKQNAAPPAQVPGCAKVSLRRDGKQGSAETNFAVAGECGFVQIRECPEEGKVFKMG
jgi:hypothetical protein